MDKTFGYRKVYNYQRFIDNYQPNDGNEQTGPENHEHFIKRF